MDDIRWLQRLEQFSKALTLLKDTALETNLSVAERAGLIQFYEMSIELAWKVLKDYLEDQGFMNLQGPRDVIKQAFQQGIIHNGHVWAQALQDRNLTVHTYNESIALKVELLIRELYLPLLNQLEYELRSRS